MIRLVILAVGCVLLGRAAWAADVPTRWDPEKFIAPSEIQPGMKGVGYSVWKGATIEPFDVEAIGVMSNGVGNREVIIARISGHDLDKTGVIAGMSGSPIYFDGRLAGALAFGWNFMLEPICGITPIGQMLPLMDLPGSDPGSWEIGGPAGAQPVTLSAEDVEQLQDFPVQGSVRLEPLATPLLVDNLPADIAEEMKRFFAPLGLVPMALGGPAAGYEDLDPELAPGSAITVPLIMGDARMTVLGTTTYVDGDQAIGFGHPFMATGKSAMPLGNGVIYGVLANQQISSKLGTFVRPLGTLRQDQAYGIAGAVGALPETVPLTASLDVAYVGAHRDYSFQLAPDRRLLTSLATMAIGGVVADAAPMGGAFTAQGTVTIKPVGHDPVVSSITVSERGRAGYYVMMLLNQYMAAVLDNPFGRLAVESVHVDVHLAEGYRQYFLEEVRPAYSHVRPGEDLPVTVVYRSYEGDRQSSRTTIPIPETADDGPLFLIASDAETTVRLEVRRAAMRYRPTTLERYLELLNLQFPENELTLSLLSPERGISAYGAELPNLPGSVLSVLGASMQRDLVQPTRGTIVSSATVDVDGVMNGAAIAQIMVDRYAR